MWKSLSGRERAVAGLGANPSATDVQVARGDRTGHLARGNVRRAALGSRGGARRSGFGRAIAVLSVLLILVALFALEFRLALSFVQACMHSLPVWQDLDRR